MEFILSYNSLQVELTKEDEEVAKALRWRSKATLDIGNGKFVVSYKTEEFPSENTNLPIFSIYSSNRTFKVLQTSERIAKKCVIADSTILKVDNKIYVVCILFDARDFLKIELVAYDIENPLKIAFRTSLGKSSSICLPLAKNLRLSSLNDMLVCVYPSADVITAPYPFKYYLKIFKLNKLKIDELYEGIMFDYSEGIFTSNLVVRAFPNFTEKTLIVLSINSTQENTSEVRFLSFNDVSNVLELEGSLILDNLVQCLDINDVGSLLAVGMRSKNTGYTTSPKGSERIAIFELSLGIDSFLCQRRSYINNKSYCTNIIFIEGNRLLYISSVTASDKEYLPRVLALYSLDDNVLLDGSIFCAPLTENLYYSDCLVVSGGPCSFIDNLTLYSV